MQVSTVVVAAVAAVPVGGYIMHHPAGSVGAVPGHCHWQPLLSQVTPAHFGFDVKSGEPQAIGGAVPTQVHSHLAVSQDGAVHGIPVGTGT
jgi:hypothetical protein